MLRRITHLLPALLLLLAFSGLSQAHAHAQDSTWQTYTAPGAQFATPPGWQSVPADPSLDFLSPGDALDFIQSPDQSESASITADSFTTLPDLGQLAIAFMTQDDSGYLGIGSPVPITVPGADSAVEIAASFQDQAGNTYDEFAAVAASGTNVYILDAYDPTGGSDAPAVIASFALTPDAAATPQTEASFPPASTAAAQPAPADTSTGHTFYASTHSGADTIYCDDDPAWQSLSSRYLSSYPSLDAAEAALPGYHLHQPC